MDNKRTIVSLLITFGFLVLAVTGVLAFVLPFSIRIIGLHSLIGFIFIGLITQHLLNNWASLSTYLRTRVVWVVLGLTLLLAGCFYWQPAPIRAVLGLSRNLGPAMERFEVTENGLQYHYAPDKRYTMALTVRTGTSFDVNKPPHFVIWLENAAEYHIKTLHRPQELTPGSSPLPYWDFKRRGWEEAKREADEGGRDLAEELEVDGVSGATENSSFNPADYILPTKTEESLPYRLLIEIEQPDDDQPSLVYAVDIDNAAPRVFQLLDLVGFPTREADDEKGEEVWGLRYVDDRFDSALKLIDSALLRIERQYSSDEVQAP